MSRAQVVRARSRWVYGGLAFFALFLVGRMLFLQVFQASYLTDLARKQRTREISLASVRGEIVDRNNRELAVSVEASSIYAQPVDFEDPPERIAARLAPVLKMSETDLRASLKGTHWRWIARQQDQATGKAVKALKISGVGVIRESKRLYPKDTLAATLLGFVGIDNQGLAGIEHGFDKVLRGSDQKLHVQVDARGREILRANAGSPLLTLQADGARVVLTIDETIQHIAQRELSKSMEKHQAKRGAVLIMDPSTGNLLAFAVMPTYNPNHYKGTKWELIKNWAVNDVYEPGSTIKIFTVASALEGGRITPETVFPCGPNIKVAGHTISDHDAPPGIRQLTPEGILEVSSNVGSLLIAQRMSGEFHRDMLEKFGFGANTGSGIKGESKGLLPKLPWPVGRQSSISYGYGLSVTPLQILTAAGAIANEGRLHQPRLIDKVVSPDGSLIEAFPVASPSQVISPKVAKEVLTMLHTVVESGTGKSARIPGYNVAGKTGTANKSRESGIGYTNDVISSFLGFVPAEKPQLVVLALIDSPQKGHYAAQTAAPLFQAVSSETLRYLGVQPYVPNPSDSEKSHAAR
ncbi:penicillin-binding protein 2 [bacterium]|nr:penicillin-binding protein 2 [bacterium]